MIFAEADGTNTLFRMFANANKNKQDFICTDVDYVKGIYKVYKHFFYEEYVPEFYGHDDFGLSFDECRQLVFENKTENQNCDYTPYLKPYEKESKYICGSFINWDEWQRKNPWVNQEKNLKTEFNQIRKGEVQSRAFNYDTLNTVLELCKSHPDFIDIGDSRCNENKTPEDLIQSLEYLRNSKLYVGMVGTYSRWTTVHNVPFVTMMEYENVRMKSLHKLFILPEHNS